MANGYRDPAGAMHRAIIVVGEIIRAQGTIKELRRQLRADRGRVAGRCADGPDF
jgi:hypothetical protein